MLGAELAYQVESLKKSKLSTYLSYLLNLSMCFQPLCISW
ncbi:hypothetical protein DB42_EU00280 [Neochlamydia sp. EPS4]|nr:hypothetical protein DB42_EU00280 [Neochlamydia sp. EPS4]